VDRTALDRYVAQLSGRFDDLPLRSCGYFVYSPRRIPPGRVRQWFFQHHSEPSFALVMVNGVMIEGMVVGFRTAKLVEQFSKSFPDYELVT
jgi:hypothetical protein